MGNQDKIIAWRYLTVFLTHIREDNEYFQDQNLQECLNYLIQDVIPDEIECLKEGTDATVNTK